jgi:hypothetical protein
MAQDTVRLGRLAEGMLAARMQLKHPDCLDMMLGVALSLALLKPSRAQSLLAHVEECRRAGIEVDELLLEDVRGRLQLVEVIGAADQATRQMWDERLSQPQREWSWQKPNELRALRELAEWLVPGHPAAAAFARVVPPAWWELWLTHKGANPPPVEMQAVLPLRPIVATEPRSPGDANSIEGIESGSDAAADADPLREAVDSPGWETRLRLGWFTAGGILGALAAVVLQVMDPVATDLTATGEGNHQPDPGPAVSEQPRPEGPAYAENASGSWCREERARLAEELEPVTRLGAVKKGTWSDHSIFLTGQTPELPLASGMFRKVLTLLHLDPPVDPETRMNVPRLLLRRAQDEEVILLWEKCVEGDSGLAPEIAAAAAESLDQPSMPWTPEQRERLARLAKR